MDTRDALALVGVFSSAILIFIKLLQPTTLQIIVNEEVIQSTSIPTVYSLLDLIAVAIGSMVFSTCFFHLIKPNNATTLAPPNPEHWSRTLQGLVDADEQTVYRIVVDAGGTMFQGELVEQSGFSKTKISLILDRLEAQRILERKRYGMSNIVQLK